MHLDQTSGSGEPCPIDAYIVPSLLQAKRALDTLLKDRVTLEAISEAGTLLVETFRRRGRVFACGNGGSMCDAMHFAEELTGRYRENRVPLAALAIGDVAHLTCVSNDMGYDHVFSRYIEAHGRAGDCLVALSTSGSSSNVLGAADAANAIGMTILGLTGNPDAALASRCTIHICTPAGQFADRVQELHIKVLHALVELVEHGLFSRQSPGALAAQPRINSG